MKRGEIWFVSLHRAAGHEQRGNRPVLIVSPTRFNEITGAPIVVPITTGGEFARRIGFAVPLSGTATSGVIRCDQPRSLHLSARGAHRVESIPEEILNEVLARVSALFV